VVERAAVAACIAATGVAMPWSAVQLKPGVDTQLTLAANQAGVSQSQMIRYKEGLIQTYGGWDEYVSFTIPSTVRDLHPWQDVTGTKHLAIGATQNLAIITDGQNQDVTPQTGLTNSTPDFTVTAGSDLVTVHDPGVGIMSVYDNVYFNTQVAIDGMVLQGGYPIEASGGAGFYTFRLPQPAPASAAGGTVPVFTTTAGDAVVHVNLPNHGYQAIPGLFRQFIAPTDVGGLTIVGKYQVTSVIDADNFTINAVRQAATSDTKPMNGGEAQLAYFIAIGAPQSGTGFGILGFGDGGYGTGVPLVGTPGAPITAKDWTMDNMGETLLACPEDGPIYAWSPDLGLQNAQVVATAPFFNGGIFVSMPQQILVAWRSTLSTGVQDPLVVRWSDATSWTIWTVSNQTTAGSFHLPTGSRLIGGLQCPMFGLLSTDLEVWTMTYVGGTVIFNFNHVGTGCGWVGPHACGILAGNPYWMSNNNFFTLGQNGVTPLPCTVWDAVFQNLSKPNAWKTRAAPNSAFNEVAWFYPSAASAGENDSYVKVHMEGQEFEWDFGTIDRTAWIDISVLGMPIGVDHFGQVLQHETGNAITGAGMSTFRSGWWTIAEGEELSFVDFIIPDFIWGTRAGPQNARVTVTFYSVNYLGDTPYTHGPYEVTRTTEYINTRIRGRFMSVLIQSNVADQFWRLGRIRFRFARSGRR